MSKRTSVSGAGEPEIVYTLSQRITIRECELGGCSDKAAYYIHSRDGETGYRCEHHAPR